MVKGSEDVGFMEIAGFDYSIKELCTHNLNQKIEMFLLYCGV